MTRLVVLWFWLCTGCAARDVQRMMYAEAAPPPPPPEAVFEEGEVARMSGADEFGILDDAPDAPPSPSTPGSAPKPDAPQGAADARMVHYDGWARLRVANPRDALEAVATIAEQVGGRTERMAGSTVTVRVPVASFAATWLELLALGDVMDRSVRADDVTESFLAVELRARVLRETRDRLIVLLAKSRTEDERLRLLLELTTVTEELDRFESKLRTLRDLASFSRITIEAVAREAFTASGQRPALDGFQWIRGLSPFRRGVWQDDQRIALDTPEGLVELAARGPYAAESADGTVVWTWRVPNDPVGTGAFWAQAVGDRIASEFAKPTDKALGSWSCLALDQPGEDEPYRWQICVRPDGKHLDVAQVYFPSPAQVVRFGPAIDAMFGDPGGA